MLHMTRIVTAVVVLTLPSFGEVATVHAAEAEGWDSAGAARYLDERAQAWLDFADADLGKGATKTTCVSCHTLVPYAMARPALAKLRGEKEPPQLKAIRQHSMLRASRWKDLAQPEIGLIYDTPDQKRKESLGTEAIFQALILATTDRAEGRTSPADVTKQAFANLWALQIKQDGTLSPKAGGWEWIDFELEPWESKDAGYFGAALAAIALGTAPGHDPAAPPEKNVASLVNYLQRNFGYQNLYNRAWALGASAALPDLLSAETRRTTIDSLFEAQQADGGWRLASLGDYVRTDGTEQDEHSGGYATGMVLHLLHKGGVPKTDPRIAKGLAWLRANQSKTGEWSASSVNVKRDPTTHVGKFMSDAATAFAILALTD